jgi:hypothetical protein
MEQFSNSETGIVLIPGADISSIDDSAKLITSELIVSGSNTADIVHIREGILATYSYICAVKLRRYGYIPFAADVSSDLCIYITVLADDTIAPVC